MAGHGTSREFSRREDSNHHIFSHMRYTRGFFSFLDFAVFLNTVKREYEVQNFL
jgi:hypothetical protein